MASKSSMHFESGLAIKLYDQYKPRKTIPKLAHRNVAYFNKCLCGEHTISVGDFVLVYNSDSLDQDTNRGCDVAQILLLYEVQDCSKKDTSRAIVQWYSRPETIPEKHLDNDDITLDFDIEIIEDHRPYDSDISLQSIFRKCYVICGNPKNTALQLLKLHKKGENSPIFVCRYKFTRTTVKRYQLMPLPFDHINQPDALRMATNGVEFLNMAYFNNKNTVSPIRIVGGRSVVRLSQKTPTSAKEHITGSLPTKFNGRSARRSVMASACRNLNLTLNMDSPNAVSDTDCLNYSIVKDAESKAESANEMKIKLRISHQQNSGKSHKTKISDDSGNDTKTNMKTPRTVPVEPSTLETPISMRTRCKSILKSEDCPINDGHRRTVVCFVDEENTPSKRTVKRRASSSKTPTTKNSCKKTLSETPSKAKFQTPTHKLRAFRAGEVTPLLEERQTPRSRRKSLHFACDKLSVSNLFKSLPCREKEFENIYNFLRGKIEDDCGGCMYVSGVPGTGKTATVTTVIRTLQREMENNELAKFEFLEINGMRLTEPRQAYVHIYRQLTGKTMPWKQAYMLLEKRFTTSAPKRLTTVLLVDELDILCNRRQDVVYNLLDWPTKNAARLVVVTIANTMDLPERLLIGKFLFHLK